MSAFHPERAKLLQWPANTGDLCLSEAVSSVSETYIGRCVVLLDDEKQICFPNYAEAAKASRLAVNLLIGGYSSAVVLAAEVGQAVTHDTAEEWVFN